MVKKLRALALTMTAVACAAVAFAQLPVKTTTVVVDRGGQVVSVNGVRVSAEVKPATAPAAAPVEAPKRTGLLGRLQAGVDRKTGAQPAGGADSSGPCDPGFTLVKGTDLCEDVKQARPAEDARKLREVGVRAGLYAPMPSITDAQIIAATLELTKGATGPHSPQTLHVYGKPGDDVIINWYRGGVGYDVANSLWREPAFVQFVIVAEGSPEAAQAAAVVAAPAPATSGVPAGYTESTMACDPATFKASAAICTANKRIAVPSARRP